MPTYSYACTECGNRFDVVQAFTDDALTTCDQCSGRLRKVFGSVGVVFKGSGFYRTDSRSSGKAATNGSNGHSASSTAESSSAGNGSTDKGSPDKAAKSGDSAGKTEKASTSSTTSAPATAST